MDRPLGLSGHVYAQRVPRPRYIVTLMTLFVTQGANGGSLRNPVARGARWPPVCRKRIPLRATPQAQSEPAAGAITSLFFAARRLPFVS